MASDRHQRVPEPPPGRSLTARDAVLTIALAVLLLVLAKGPSVRELAAEMQPGLRKDVVTAVGGPVGWVADRFPIAGIAADITAEIRGEDGGSAADAFAAGGAGQTTGTRGIPPVSVDSFDPVALDGAKPARKLETLLTTGDSMIQPLDAELARRLSGDGVEVVRDTHFGTAITNPDLLDWGRTSAQQVRDHEPDAVVVFLGAGEGFDLEDAAGETVKCCGADYAALYAARVRRMMSTYRRGGKARVYWMLIPAPRDKDDAEVIRMTNAAIDIASVPWRRDVRIVDLDTVLTPGSRYRSSMSIDGREELVREADGLHLSRPGARLAADAVMARLAGDFAVGDR